ncbi:C2 domain-containing protein 5-like [Centruroides sculpturatus]|uniref:C2 domain-containing protein 5-like n=1 Tax=Centruroides sculpturatus TaxID=218467 RepID=UPI000C6C96F2|nr:C2 domain-containing protein 5-like [Centruroides sculpturatus]
MNSKLWKQESNPSNRSNDTFVNSIPVTYNPVLKAIYNEIAKKKNIPLTFRRCAMIFDMLRNGKDTPDTNKLPGVYTVPIIDHRTEDLSVYPNCGLCHIPYSESSVPFPVNLVRCHICRRAKVPDVLFMTIEPPSNIPITGKGCFIQARVCRVKKDGKGEQNAKEISDSLPFLEYELHRQLLNKLKVKGMNGLFGLKVQVSVGEKMLIGIATGTGAYLTALPSPSIPKIVKGKNADSSKYSEIQKLIQEAVINNRDTFDIKPPVIDSVLENCLNGKTEYMENSDEELAEIDFSTGNKDTCILEVDDAEDIDIIALLMDPKLPKGFEMCNTESQPGVDNFVTNLQMFTRIYRTKFPPGNYTSRQFSQLFETIIQSLFVKLRRLVPCCLANINFQIELPEQEEMQVAVWGVAIGLGDPNLLTTITSNTKSRLKQSSSLQNEIENDLIFVMDEEKHEQTPSLTNTKYSSKYSCENFDYHVPFREYFGIEMTPLSHVPSGKIERYMGNLDFFFIRESTSVREVSNMFMLKLILIKFEFFFTVHEKDFTLANDITTICAIHAIAWFKAAMCLLPLTLSAIAKIIKIYLSSIDEERLSSLALGCNYADNSNKDNSLAQCVFLYYLHYYVLEDVFQVFFFTIVMLVIIIAIFIIFNIFCLIIIYYFSYKQVPFREYFGIEMTPLSHVPSGKIERYMGNLDFFFIRESTSVRENGGLNGFIQSFVTEVLAIVRAHVSALGGNAMVAFQMTECILLYNPHKNQGQCLINVAGDAVLVQYSPLQQTSCSDYAGRANVPVTYV